MNFYMIFQITNNDTIDTRLLQIGSVEAQSPQEAVNLMCQQGKIRAGFEYFAIPFGESLKKLSPTIYE